MKLWFKNTSTEQQECLVAVVQIKTVNISKYVNQI